MRRLLTAIAILLLASPLLAQTGGNAGSTKAAQEFAKALTASTFFGVPRYTTVALPTCDAANTGAVAFNTTSTFLTFCNGTAWGDANSGAASAITPGSTTIGTATNCFAYADGSSVLQCDTSFVSNNSGAGNGVFTVRKTPSGGSATSNFLNVTGTLPAVTSASTYGVNIQVTGAGSSSNQQRGVQVNLVAGYTGSSATAAGVFANGSAATGSTTSSATAANIGVLGNANTAPTTGSNIGVFGIGVAGDQSFGGMFQATTGKVGGTNVGAIGYASNNTNDVEVGGYFGFVSPDTITFISSALQLDNGAIADPILVASDNSAALPTTGATATWQIADGAWPQVGNGVLTNATMAAEVQGRDSCGLVHSYTWTNAQVAALAGTAGDITVATLPAKTQVLDAAVVITGQAAGPTTVTVSLGDAIGGTPFINYIVASDAKAAVNTYYGDAVGERGTSIDVEFYNLPSYTATTLVTAHFISTGADLSTVTGSTGRVILKTCVLP